MANKQMIELDMWNDDWFCNLSANLQFLFIYLIANPQINPAGLYKIDLFLLEKRRGFKREDLNQLVPKVIYDEKTGVIWIKNYFKKNSRSPSIRKSVISTLNFYKESCLVKKFVNYYKDFNFHVDSTPCMETMNSVCTRPNDNDNVLDPCINTNTPCKLKKTNQTIGPIREFSDFPLFLKDVTHKLQNMWIATYLDSEWICMEIKKAQIWEASNGEKKNKSRFMSNWLARAWKECGPSIEAKMVEKAELEKAHKLLMGDNQQSQDGMKQ